MITDQQWLKFAQHIKPNATIRWGAWGEGYLIENFPYWLDNERIEVNFSIVCFHGAQCIDDGRLKSDSLSDLRVQLCESPHEEFVDAEDLEYWYRGEFMTFDQIIALDA